MARKGPKMAPRSPKRVQTFVISEPFKISKFPALKCFGGHFSTTYPKMKQFCGSNSMNDSFTWTSLSRPIIRDREKMKIRQETVDKRLPAHPNGHRSPLEPPWDYTWCEWRRKFQRHFSGIWRWRCDFFSRPFLARFWFFTPSIFIPRSGRPRWT